MADKPNDLMGILTLDETIQQLQKIRETRAGTSQIWMEHPQGLKACIRIWDDGGAICFMFDNKD
ncbi:hypothetical protein [Streptomyces sp. CBMA123]|uniref:hypothetical protein n=1 Tax=Streptomyces sp. CBMA123 TaxID=1896313 RepID=UPI0016621AEB|nr:hypothetical protein [Streptomyces sp. CBMA123]MBD0692584.1 hypothetical protein [Streptomyces sp. CBMA123]